MNSYKYNELYLGLKESFYVQITEQKMEEFRNMTSDNNPLHLDSSFANQEGFHGVVVYGFVTASFLSTLAGVYLPGKYGIILNVNIDFPNPVYMNDVLYVSGEIVEKNDLFRTITVKTIITNQNNQKVCRGKMRIGVRR